MSAHQQIVKRRTNSLESDLDGVFGAWYLMMLRLTEMKLPLVTPHAAIGTYE